MSQAEKLIRRASWRDPSSGQTEVAEFFGAPGEELFGITHLPAGEPVAGIVVCAPVGAEQVRNYRREVLLARALAARGIAVQRFHYRGTGNSYGDRAATTFASMTEDARVASEQLASLANGVRMSYMGTRFGALVATAAAVSGGPLVLWEPVVEFDRYFEELARAVNVGALKAGTPKLSVEDLTQELRRDGFIEVLGFAFHRLLFESAAGVEIENLVGTRARPVLLVQISRGAAPRERYGALQDAWTTAGHDVTLKVIKGHEVWWARTGADYHQSETRRPMTQALLRATLDWCEKAHTEAWT